MNFSLLHFNLLLAWVWILLGFISGLVLGLFFRDDKWLGGYASYKRRMYRLGHISFFGLGALNLLFSLTMRNLSPEGTLVPVASLAFIVGAVAMPVCCGVMAQFPKAHLIFAVPVVSLILGGTLTLALLVEEPQVAGTANTTAAVAINAQPLTRNSP